MDLLDLENVRDPAGVDDASGVLSRCLPGGAGLRETAHQAMAPFIDRLVELADGSVQAVCVVSSSARVEGNPTAFVHGSDFDIAVVLDVPMAASEWRASKPETYRILADRIPPWVPNFLFYVPVPWGRMEVNVHQMVFQYEADARTMWDGEKCDTYVAKREDVLDRDGLFRDLIGAKADRARGVLVRESERLANRVTWDVREIALRQATRLGPAAGHLVLNHAVDEVIDCVYASRGRFVPNKKWKLSLLADLGLLDHDVVGCLVEAMRCEPASADDLMRRVDVLESVCEAIDGLAVRGPGAVAIRRRFQTRLEVREVTVADGLAARFPVEAADDVRDLANFGLCGSWAEFLDLLDRPLPSEWEPHRSRISAYLS